MREVLRYPPGHTLDHPCREIVDGMLAQRRHSNAMPSDWVRMHSVMIRKEARIYRLYSPSTEQGLAVKIFDAANNPAHQAKRLFRVLSQFSPVSTPEERFSVPRPIAYIPSHHAVVMQWAKGETMKRRLVRGRFSSASTRRNIRKCGEWLRWMHAAADLMLEPCDDAAMLVILHKRLARCRKKGIIAALHRQALDTALKSLESRTFRWKDLLPHSYCHGDFKPSNILFDAQADKVVGIDLHGRKRSPVTYDICRFLSHLDIMRFPFFGSYAEEMTRPGNPFHIFLEAYGAHGGDLPHDRLIFHYYLMILESHDPITADRAQIIAAHAQAGHSVKHEVS